MPSPAARSIAAQSISMSIRLWLTRCHWAPIASPLARSAPQAAQVIVPSRKALAQVQLASTPSHSVPTLLLTSRQILPLAKAQLPQALLAQVQQLPLALGTKPSALARSQLAILQLPMVKVQRHWASIPSPPLTAQRAAALPMAQ